MSNQDLIGRLQQTVDGDGSGVIGNDDRALACLEIIAGHFEARTCTLHRNTGAGVLESVACLGLPKPVIELTRVIPIGKGMAGICAERAEPVTVCNLQTDDSGVVRPGARTTEVAGALVVPVMEGDTVRATLGIGKADAHDYQNDEIDLLVRCGSILLKLLGD